MAGRPRVRTVGVRAAVVGGMRDVYGTAAQAYRVLGMAGVVSYENFQRAYNGQSVTPGDASVIEGAWARWVAELASRHLTQPVVIPMLANPPALAVS